MRIGILGPLEVVLDDGREVDVGGSRLQALLARLAIDAGGVVSATALADAVWDGDLPADELHALQALVSRLRRALGDPSLIVQSAGGYRLAVDPDAIDAYRFERLAGLGAARLRDGDPARALTTLDEALALWRGQPLGDVGSLEDLRVSVQADRAAAEIALGRAAGLVGELEALAGEHPLHERIAGLLMRALYASGRQADALVVYERVRARLADELGASPSPELQEIHLSVLQGEVEAPVRSRSNLTSSLTSFVGREQELARVGELLREQRLLTLVGAGGAGKTRLATELAARAADVVRDGAWLVELAPVGEASGLEAAVLGALGLREVRLLDSKSTMSAADEGSHLLEVLADRDMLIVLDNCEHLLEPVASLVDELLGACPSLRILCTSREPLAITGEMIVAIPPLQLPPEDVSTDEALAVPAVRLFADRAAAASAGFVVDDDNVALVIEVCRRVDGLPLAIELAAARLRSMTLGQLASRLDDRFRLLAGGSRTAIARQRTLRAVVDWSWDLLEEPERALLRRLAVFTGGASLEAVESVCAGGPVGAADVFDLLCALVDKSLVQIGASDGPRYRLLETIREYGLERLDEAGELADTRAAHAAYFAALAIEAAPHLRSAEQLSWLARLHSEHDNVLAAVRYLGESGDAATVMRVVVSLLWFWMLAGSRQEVMAWIEFARQVPGEVDRLDRLLIDGVHALVQAIPGGESAGDPWAALLATLEQLDGADLSEHPVLAAVRPLLAIALGRERVSELLELSAEHPDPWVRATVPFARVQIYENEGDMEGMRAALEETLQAFREVGDRWGLATTLTELSGLRTVDGDLDGAESALAQTSALMEELGASNGIGMVQMRLADLRARRGDYEGAYAMLIEALQEQDRFAEEGAMMRITLSHLALRLGDTERARELAAHAMRNLGDTEHERPQQRHGRAMVLNGLAAIEVADGALSAAEDLLREAYRMAVATTDMPIVATVGVSLAALAVERGELVSGAELLGAAAQLRGAEDPTHPEISRLTAKLRSELGDDELASRFARGQALDREGALALLHAAAVGAERERDEHR